MVGYFSAALKSAYRKCAYFVRSGNCIPSKLGLNRTESYSLPSVQI